MSTHSRHPLSLLIAAAATVAATLGAAPAAAAAAPPGPPLSAPADELASSLHCPASFTGAHEPVLLVHATALSGEQDFSANYARVLPRMGYDVCTVDLVDYARGDIQASAERTVYAIRTMADRSHRKVEVIGHSEGPLPVRWAIRWWPDIRFLVDDLIGIAPPYHGWRETDLICSVGCNPALWQMRIESRYMAVQKAGEETPGPVSYTSVYSMTDELVQPFQTAELRGGTNIPVQQVCPGRAVGHIQMVYDAAAYAVVLDALTHRGPADLGRLDRSLCTRLTLPGVSSSDLLTGEVGFLTLGGPKLATHHVAGEPPLASYAR